nr:hypothetical protein CFP56_52534 [Quercus suber]
MRARSRSAEVGVEPDHVMAAPRLMLRRAWSQAHSRRDSLCGSRRASAGAITVPQGDRPTNSKQAIYLTA